MAPRRTIAIVAVVVVVIVVAASLGAYALVTSGKKGTVQVFVGDSFGPWSHVNVTFDQVQVHKANASNNSWISIAIKNGTLDLAKLVNISALLGEGKVGVGKYTQLRIDVKSATGMMTNGTKVVFTVPSGELRTTNPFNVVSGGTTKIVIDIDLEHSILHENGMWKFKPVLGHVTESS